MNCPICGRENLHEPNQYLIITVSKSLVVPGKLIAVMEDTRPAKTALDVSVVTAMSIEGLHAQVDKAWGGRDRHWHWYNDFN